MFRSLYARLTIALLVVLGVVAGLYLALGIFTTELYLGEVRQKLHRDLAAHLIEEGLLTGDGTVDREGLAQVIHMLMVVNPAIEVYVLGAGGEVQAYSTPPGKLQRERVALEPIRRFLGPHARLPILGDDPRDPERRQVFSAAPIGDAERPDGYVYVVLGGQVHAGVVDRLRGSYALRMGAGAAAAGLLFAVAAGALSFALLTRRLRRLDATMRRFEAGGFASPPVPAADPGRGGDEIDRLRGSFERMAERISRQLAQLERVDHVRRELVANVAHDLRTPLASLHGYLETLLLKGDRLGPGERRHYLEIATRHSRRLGKRVAELFELARLDAADVRLELETFSVAELAQDVVQKFEIEASRKDLRLELRRQDGLPRVRGDIGRIERVLENLLGNALRHTPPHGHVTVSLGRAASAVSIQVRDSGPGIPEQDLGSIFDRFYRSRNDDDAGGGAGLGLAIAKRIVELHGGTIGARSRPGQGAAFTFTLPAAGG